MTGPDQRRRERTGAEAPRTVVMETLGEARPASPRRAVLVALTAMLQIPIGCATVAAAPIRLRNDLTPGALASYVVRCRSVRTTPTLRYLEELTYEQTGHLTLVVLASGRQSSARRAWMMEMNEAAVVSVTRDGQPVTEETFEPKLLGLPPKAVQLWVTGIDSKRAAASAVVGSHVQRAATLLALDFAHWPDALVNEGDTWQAPADREELTGNWSHRYVATEGKGSARLAIGEYSFSGALNGPWSGAAGIESVTGVWRWLVARRTIQSVACDVVLSYGEQERPHELTLHLETELDGQQRLTQEQLSEAGTEVGRLSELAGDLGTPGSEQAQTELRQFIDAHPRSLWLPVAGDLLERAEFDARALADLGSDRLVELLTGLITKWQLSAMAGDMEPLEPIRATMRQLTRTNRAALHGLARAADANQRAMAVFCVAFGDGEEDLAGVLLACRDAEARVRAWAAYGLAERRDAGVDPAVLDALLADGDDKVRQRACMAVRGCVPRDSPQRAGFFKRLLAMVRGDESDEVKSLAAEAIDALAVPDDLPALIEAEYEQDVPPARRQLEATIRRLGGKPRE